MMYLATRELRATVAFNIEYLAVIRREFAALRGDKLARSALAVEFAQRLAMIHRFKRQIRLRNMTH